MTQTAQKRACEELPPPKVSGGDRQRQAATAQGRRGGASPRPRSGAAPEVRGRAEVIPQPEVRGRRREEPPHARGQERRREELPHLQGVAAAGAQEVLPHGQGQEGRH